MAEAARAGGPLAPFVKYLETNEWFRYLADDRDAEVSNVQRHAKNYQRAKIALDLFECDGNQARQQLGLGMNFFMKHLIPKSIPAINDECLAQWDDWVDGEGSLLKVLNFIHERVGSPAQEADARAERWMKRSKAKQGYAEFAEPMATIADRRFATTKAAWARSLGLDEESLEEDDEDEELGAGAASRAARSSARSKGRQPGGQLLAAHREAAREGLEELRRSLQEDTCLYLLAMLGNDPVVRAALDREKRNFPLSDVREMARLLDRTKKTENAQKGGHRPFQKRGREASNGGGKAPPKTKPQARSTCYNCGKPGHLSKDCKSPNNPNCYNCGGKGHLARDCKNKSTSK